jgi:hypothetical protein
MGLCACTCNRFASTQWKYDWTWMGVNHQHQDILGFKNKFNNSSMKLKGLNEETNTFKVQNLTTKHQK